MNVRSAIVVAALVSAGCWSDDETLEGELVGDFEAEGFLIEQSCGNALDTPDPLDLEFSLSVDDEVSGRAYVDVFGSIFTGTVSGDEYNFQEPRSWTVIEPNPAFGIEGCFVNQVDFFSVTLDGTVVTGTQVTEVTPVTGSDCLRAVDAGGGAFSTLPCRVEYILNGNQISD